MFLETFVHFYGDTRGIPLDMGGRDFEIDSKLPLGEQRYAEQVAIKMHKSVEKHGSIHREAEMLSISLDATPVWKLLCLFIASMSMSSLVRGGEENGDWRRDRHVARTR